MKNNYHTSEQFEFDFTKDLDDNYKKYEVILKFLNSTSDLSNLDNIKNTTVVMES